MTKRRLLLLTWLAAGFSSPVLAQKVGPEFQVNTYTPFRQGESSVASDASGNFVVVWESNGDRDGSGQSIFGQRYDNEGNRVGGEFQVNTYTRSNQGGPSVASDASGNFVVVWGSYLQDGDSWGVFGQRFDREGNPLGSEFQVNTHTTSLQSVSSVASDASGNFVVVWRSEDDQDGAYGGVFGQRYDSSGNPLGGEFQANTYTTLNQERPQVASDASGNFVVVWDSESQDYDRLGVFGQRFDRDGNPLGGEFQVNTYTVGYQSGPSVASDASGNFVVVWQGLDQDGDRTGAFGQRYDSSGSRLGGEFQVNTYTTGNQIAGSAAFDANGNFVVILSSDGQDGDDTGVFARRYDSEGNSLGSEFQVNTYTTSDQGREGASIAVDKTGNFVVVWESYGQDGHRSGVFGQRFSGECRSTATAPTFLCPGNPR